MFRVQLQEFPRGSEFNLGRLGTLRAARDQNTQLPYVDCESDEQVHALRKLHGITGPPIQLTDSPEPATPLTTHGKSVNQIKLALEKIRNRAHLVQLQDSELNHPKYPNGRPAVVQLIRERLEQARDQ